MLANILPSILCGAILGALMSWAVARNKKTDIKATSKPYFYGESDTYVKVPFITIEVTMKAYQDMGEQSVKKILLKDITKALEEYVQVTSIKVDSRGPTFLHTARVRVVPTTEDMHLVP